MFSFFDEKEDYRGIINAALKKDWEKEIKDWKNKIAKWAIPESKGNRTLGESPSKKKFKKNSTKKFTETHKPEEIDKNYWRPSTALALSLKKNENIIIDEYHLFYQPNLKDHQEDQKDGVVYIKNAIERLAGETIKGETIKVILEKIDIGNGHDFQTVYSRLFDYFRKHFNTSQADDRTKGTRYLVHVTSGSQAARMCLFLLAQNRWVPAECVQLWTTRKDDPVGQCSITTLGSSPEEKSKLLQNSPETFGGIIETTDKDYSKTIAYIKRIADKTNEPILLLGDTGVGKSQIAKLIFDIRKESLKNKGDNISNKNNEWITSDGAFKWVNCSGLDDALVNDTLFGHVKGAYTGADEKKEGLVKLANGGVLFLDEIGNLPMDTQGKLLTLIDEHKYNPVGDRGKPDDSKFLLICATNEWIPDLVEKGKFRRDLFERIRTWTFRIPNLKARPSDIDLNIDNLLNHFTKDYGPNIQFSSELSRQNFLSAIKGMTLKGNFRELRRIIWRMATIATLENNIINDSIIQDEIERLENEQKWDNKTSSNQDQSPPKRTPSRENLSEKVWDFIIHQYDMSKINKIDLQQLRYVIEVCVRSKSGAEAARELFNASLKDGGNAADYMSRYFRRKTINQLGIDFDWIESKAKELCQETTS